MLNAFIATWNYCAHGGKIKRASYELGHGREPFGLLASVPTLDSPLRTYICDYLNHATETIDLTMAYFAPDDQLVRDSSAPRGEAFASA